MPPCASVALDVIAANALHVIALGEFELRMHQRGCDKLQMRRAVACLQRRGWLELQDGHLHVTEAGGIAASAGFTVAPLKRGRRAGLRRMPQLFT